MSGTFLVVQWLSLSLPTQGAWVRSLVRELDPTCHNEHVVQPNKLKNNTHTHTHTHTHESTTSKEWHALVWGWEPVAACYVLRERRRPWPQASTGTQRDIDPDALGHIPAPPLITPGRPWARSVPVCLFLPLWRWGWPIVGLLWGPR